MTGRILNVAERIRHRGTETLRMPNFLGESVDIDTLELAARYSGIRRVLHSNRFVNKNASDHTSGFQDLFGEVNELAESGAFTAAGIQVVIEPRAYTLSGTLSYNANNCWIDAEGAVFTQMQDGITTFKIGDPIMLDFSTPDFPTPMRFGGIRGLHVRGHSSIANSSTSIGIEFYAPFFLNIESLHVGNFYKCVDGYRFHHAFMQHWFFDQFHRSSGQAAYAIGLYGDPKQGLDSGANDLIGLKIHGSGSMSYPYESGILIRSSDQLFASLGHTIGCSYGLKISPNATNYGNRIGDISFDNFYFDIAEHANVRLEGRTRNQGATGTDGETLIGQGVYIGVRLTNCEYRRATYAVEVSIDEANGGDFNDLQILGGTARSHRDTFIRVLGPSSNKVAVDNFVCEGVTFGFGNFDNTALTSHMQLEIQSGVVLGNSHRSDRFAAARVADFKFNDDSQSIVVGNNDLSGHNATDTVDPYRFERIPGANVLAEANLYPFSGRNIQQGRGIQTENDTPIPLNSRTLVEDDRFDITGEVTAHDIDNSIYCKWFIEGVVRRSMTGLASAWASSTAYATGTIRRPTVENGFRYVAASVSDTLSGTVEPTWPTTVGNTVVDNNVTWTCEHGVPLAWAATTVYALGDIRRPTAANGFRYEVIARVGAFQSGGIQPTWPTAIGDIVVDNEITWKCIGFYGNAEWWAGASGTVVDDSRNTSALTAWAAATAYVVGHMRRPTVINGFRYEVTSIAGGGVSAGAEPTWPATVGSTVVDNEVTWTCRGPALAIALSGSTVTLTATGLPDTDLTWSYVPGRTWS